MGYHYAMSSLAFWKAVVQDKSDFLERVVALLADHGIRYCVIGGVGVNAYADPIVTEDLDIVVAADDLTRVRALLEAEFRVREFAHSFNAYDPGSRLQLQVQLHPDVPDAVDRAQERDVMDLRLPVASPRDLIVMKSEAALEPSRRASKRLKDAADIRRLIDAFPELRTLVPDALTPLVFLDE